MLFARHRPRILLYVGFPLRSKSVPTLLMELFFATHGYKTRPLPPDTPHPTDRYVHTDGEGSLAESPAFRKLVAHEGYLLQKTATDTSSQNGMAERPHQTLAERTQCFLYLAGMGVCHWADALVYVTYIGNRLHHQGIDAIPFSKWTGRRPNVKHLRAFGAKVIVKRSGHRPTKADLRRPLPSIWCINKKYGLHR